MMNDTAIHLPALDELLLPNDLDLHQSLADYSTHPEDVLFGPPSLILFERPSQLEERWCDGDADLQFPEARSSSGDGPASTAPDQSAPPPRQRSSSSGRAAGKVERKAEQNRRDAQRVYGPMRRVKSRKQIHCGGARIMSLACRIRGLYRF